MIAHQHGKYKIFPGKKLRLSAELSCFSEEAGDRDLRPHCDDQVRAALLELMYTELVPDTTAILAVRFSMFSAPVRVMVNALP